MGGFWLYHHPLRPSELCSTTYSHSLTTSPTTFRKCLVDSEAFIGSEVCCRSQPSSILFKHLCFIFFNSDGVLYSEREFQGTLEEFEYCRTSPSVLCTRSGGTIGCPPSARKPICCWWKQYAGYSRRTVKPTRSLHQESLVTFSRGFNSRRR